MQKEQKNFSHLDPIPFINKLKQCYSDLTKTVAQEQHLQEQIVLK